MFLLFILSLPFIALSIATWGGKDILISYATTALLIFYFFARKKDTKIYFPSEAKYFLLFLAYLVIVVARTYLSGGATGKDLSQLTTLVMYFFFYLLMINVFILQGKKNMVKYMNIFIFVCLVVALYSCLQAFLPTSSIVNKLFRNTISSFGVWDPDIVTSTHHKLAGLNRVSGLAAEPGMWAGFLAVPLSLLLPRLWSRFKISELFCFLGIFLGFLLTYGRSGFLALFLALLTFPCFTLKGSLRKIYTLLITIIIGVAIFAIMFADINVIVEKDWSIVERSTGMIVALRMFAANPIFGVGLGAYRDRVAGYRFEGISMAGGGGEYPYNFYLSLAAETGIVGLVLWLLFLRSFWVKLYQQINHFKEKTDEYILFAGLGLAFMSIIFCWINIGGLNFVYIFYIFALISALSKTSKSEPGLEEERHAG